MVLHSDELERIADQEAAGNTLAHDVYCGVCGYNLRTLPYVGLCPECGGIYNARPLKMQGIYLAGTHEIPYLEGITAALFLIFAGGFLSQGIIPYSSTKVFFGLVCAACGVIGGLKTWAKLQLYLTFRQVERRVESDEDD
jgi:hypothetical protein